MPTGKVKWFNRGRGYGFINPDDSQQDIFVHISAVERAGLVSLYEGQSVSYEINRDRRGRAAAVNLSVIESGEARWVKVIDARGDELLGVVGDHGAGAETGELRPRDVIEFRRCHVFGLY